MIETGCWLAGRLVVPIAPIRPQRKPARDMNTFNVGWAATKGRLGGRNATLLCVDAQSIICALASCQLDSATRKETDCNAGQQTQLGQADELGAPKASIGRLSQAARASATAGQLSIRRRRPLAWPAGRSSPTGAANARRLAAPSGRQVSEAAAVAAAMVAPSLRKLAQLWNAN